MTEQQLQALTEKQDRIYHKTIQRTAEIAAIQGHITYWQTVLMTGAYRDMNTFHLNGDPLSDKEKRDKALGIIQNHVDRLQGISDYELGCI
ncbi:hypothetical protein [Achromobacter phage Motura]|uniref:Uncharacterized protein n=1 Tax=Achromobacter phage Motura TaxID=2591403 RepID=A0A514CSP9_9CAUD|nr:hypothetical protein H1O15_gp312 [Achromobacter phage Motura]QDH83494.1 hypothetical protein [Achromobacter phage Motura]